MKKPNNTNHGGKRKNSGRHKLPPDLKKVQISPMVMPITVKRIMENKEDKTIGGYLDELVENDTRLKKD